jgi:hypothetical protein
LSTIEPKLPKIKEVDVDLYNEIVELKEKIEKLFSEGTASEIEAKIKDLKFLYEQFLDKVVTAF